MSEDQVRALFRNANPIPDAGLVTTDDIGDAAQLEAILERSSDTDIEREQPNVDSRRMTPWLVAAAVIVAIGTVALLTRQDPVNPPVATDPTLSTPTTLQVQPLDAGVANVESFISAFDDHDNAGISQVTAPGFPFIWNISETEVASLHDLLFAMDTRWEVVEPCSIPGSNPHVIQCKIAVTDRFFGPGGLDHTAAFLFSVDDQGLVTNWRDLGCCNRQDQYIKEFWLWLSIAHPNAYAEISPAASLSLPNSLPGWGREPSVMTIALAYVDEFLEGSSPAQRPSSARWVFPEGQYQAARSSEQLLAAGMPEADVPDHAGTWTLTFRAGVLTVVDTIGGRCEGTYSVESGRVSLLLGQDAGCGSAQGQVLFSAAWEESGSGIRFLDLSGAGDPTEQDIRNAIFSDVVWTKVG